MGGESGLYIPGERRGRRSWPDRNFAAVALGPIVILVVGAAVVPFLIMVWLSLSDFSFNLPGHNGAYVGFGNFAAAFSDTRFLTSLKLQLTFVLTTIPLELAMGLVCAFLLVRVPRLAGVGIFPIALPLVLAPITVGMIWRLLLHGDYGPIGYHVTQFFGGDTNSILGSTKLAFWAVALIDVWQWTPFFTIVLYAALRKIPIGPQWAAEIDGAKPRQLFMTVTLPLLRPAIAVAVLLRFMDSFKEFDKIFVMTRGGPASTTELTSIYTYVVSFDHGDLAYGSAVTILVYLIIYFVCATLFPAIRPDWSR